MPNDCWNRIVIKGTTSQLMSILNEDLQSFRPDEFKKIRVGAEILIFKLWSPWMPNMTFMNNILNKYDNLWMLNEWREEGGDAGVIVGKKDDLRSFSWDEGCIEEWHHRLRQDQVMPEPSLNQNARAGFPPSHLTFF